MVLQLALKLSTALLQKHPDSHIVKALKAVALERSGRRDEANKVRAMVLTVTCNPGMSAWQ